MAQVDYFLKIGDIKGESLGWIPVLDWFWGLSSSLPEQSTQERNPAPQDLSFVHHVDAASPAILQASCDGQVFDQAWLLGVEKLEAPIEPFNNQPQTRDFFLIKLEKVVISSLKSEGVEGPPMAKVSLHFNKQEFLVVGPSGEEIVGACSRKQGPKERQEMIKDPGLVK